MFWKKYKKEIAELKLENGNLKEANRMQSVTIVGLQKEVNLQKETIEQDSKRVIRHQGEISDCMADVKTLKDKLLEATELNEQHIKKLIEKDEEHNSLKDYCQGVLNDLIEAKEQIEALKLDNKALLKANSSLENELKRARAVAVLLINRNNRLKSDNYELTTKQTRAEVKSIKETLASAANKENKIMDRVNKKKQTIKVKYKRHNVEGVLTRWGIYDAVEINEDAISVKCENGEWITGDRNMFKIISTHATQKIIAPKKEDYINQMEAYQLATKIYRKQIRDNANKTKKPKQ